MQVLYIGKHRLMDQVGEHSHPYCELIYCTGGNGCFEIGPDRIPYREGELVLINAGLGHRNFSQEGFSNVYLALQGFSVPQGGSCKITDSENRDMGHTLNQLHHYFNLQTPHSARLVASLTRLLEEYMGAFSHQVRCSPLVERMVEMLVGRFADSGFSAQKALEGHGYHPEYARKQFLREKGVSPRQYLLNLRMEHARQLLAARRQYGLSISQVAEACGYADPLFFSRVFHRRYGCAPKDYSV